MINESLWIANIKNRASHRLNKNIKTNILIIGGGMAGISTAFNLQNSHYNITLVDSYKIGFGISSKNTGKLTFFQGYYHKIKDLYDNDTALLYLKSQQDAIEIVKKNILDYNIKCNFKGTSSYLFASDKDGLDALEKEKNFFKDNHIKIKVSDQLPIKFPIKSAIAVNDTAVFHPVKYILSLKEIIKKKKNIKLYENTPIIELKKDHDKYLALTEHNSIEADIVILCCHYPFKITDGYIPFKTTIEKAYLSASKVINCKSFSALDLDKKAYSIGYLDDRSNYVLFLSNSNSLGENVDNEQKYKEHINITTKYFHLPDYLWSNHDILTSDYLPIIGKLNDHLLMATGFNTWGMTNGTIAGKVLSDIVLNKENKYIKLFNPTRSINSSTVAYNFENILSFVNSKFNKNLPFYQDKVKIVNHDGQKYGVYIDYLNNEHYVLNTCPHMKCSLVFNMVEKTWDCPCHGSRFNVDGAVIQGPAKKDIKGQPS